MKHGGDLFQAIAYYGGAPQDWLDLSTGINPLPWPVKPDLWANTLHRLPGRAAEDALIFSARAAYDVPAEILIVPAPGTQSLIQWLPFLAPPGDAAILGPTYSEHAHSWRRAGRKVTELTDFNALPPEIRHLTLVNPNNPDGRCLDHASLRLAAEAIERRDGWLIVDESFADIDPAISCAALCNVYPIAVLRSFGKFFGLPGLRLGFLIAQPAIAMRVQAALGPWSVSTPALRIGAEALGDQAWADAMRIQLAAMAQELDRVLGSAALRIIGGTSLFRLVQHADAKALHEKLARKHIWCRRFEDLSGCLRFGLPPAQDDLSRLKEALLSP